MFSQEYDTEKQRNSREKDLLLNKAEEHRLKARKLSEELSNLKQNHVQTKQEVIQCKTVFFVKLDIFYFLQSYFDNMSG